MCTTLVLATLDFIKTFIVECDASGPWHWCIFNARRKALAFESNQLKGKNLLKPIYEK
jgi:hypothetical protein